MRSHAVRVHEIGGPEALQFEAVDLPELAPGELRLRQTAIGLNFIDVYHRTGLYPLPGLQAEPAVPTTPTTIGLEAAGVVEELGPGVDSLEVGDRVGYASRPIGAYAEQRNMPADRLLLLPEGMSDEQAAGSMLKGLTAWFLLHRTFELRAGQNVLVHAAAGGVGALLCAWAAHLGATVIGTVGSERKAQLARDHGCQHTILYREQDVAQRVQEITSGRGVHVVYDSVGKDTFQASLDALAPLGMLVSFGQSSGSPAPLELRELAKRGSLFLTRPSLLDYTARREDLVAGARALFEAHEAGVVRAEIGQRWPLAQAAEAHRALEARRTHGSSLLIP